MPKNKKSSGNTKSAYWNKQNTHQRTMTFSFFFKESGHTQSEEMNKT